MNMLDTLFRVVYWLDRGSVAEQKPAWPRCGAMTRKNTMRILLIVVAIMLCGVESRALAAGVKFDGSVQLLRVPIEISERDEGGKCYQGTAEDVNLSQFINFSSKLILTGMDNPPRTTPIDHMKHEHGRVLLHGGQAGRGWMSGRGLRSVATGVDCVTIWPRRALPWI